MNFVKLFRSRMGTNFFSKFAKGSYSSKLGDADQGAGKGDGPGAPVRQVDVPFNQAETTKEEDEILQEHLERLKEDLLNEIHFHEEQIKRHQDAIDRYRERVEDFTGKY